MGQTGTVKRTLLERVRDRLLGRPAGIPGGNDRNREFWEQAAQKDPYSAICDGWDRQKFDDSRESIVFSSGIELSRDLIVLDVACGLGRVAPFIAPQVGRYIGVDFSENMIRQARERNARLPNVEFLNNDGRTLQPLADSSVDLAWCELAFQHMEKDNTASYVRDVHRVLRPGGTFLAQLPRLDFYRDVFAFTREEAEQLFERFSRIEFFEVLVSQDETPNAYYYVRAEK